MTDHPPAPPGDPTPGSDPVSRSVPADRPPRPSLFPPMLPDPPPSPPRPPRVASPTLAGQIVTYVGIGILVVTCVGSAILFGQADDQSAADHGMGPSEAEGFGAFIVLLEGVGLGLAVVFVGVIVWIGQAAGARSRRM